MKKLNYLLSLSLVATALSACVKSDYCDVQHPHINKLVIDVDWSHIQQTKNQQHSLQLLCWDEGADVPTVSEASPDNNGHYMFDLPKPGKYHMMLVNKQSSNYFSITTDNKYQLIGATIAQIPAANENLFVNNLGQMIVKDSASVFINSRMMSYSRKMNVKILVENMFEVPLNAHLTFTGFTSDVQLVNQRYSGEYDLELPLMLQKNQFEASCTYFSARRGGDNLFQIAITPKPDLVIIKKVDISSQLQKFESEELFSTDLNVEASITFSRVDNVFDYTINYVTIDGKEVYRNGIL